MPDPLILAALGAAGLAAGFVDAIAGGGGLIALPALLAAGVPPLAALGTNKLQGAVGTTIATITYRRRGLVRVRTLLPAMLATYAGGLFGAFLVQRLEVDLLARLVPGLLIAVAGYFLLAPRLSDTDRAARLGFALLPVPAAIIGFYDGVFGPGTGSFFTLSFVMLFGLGVTRAAAHTKVLNLTSNLAALTMFIPAGAVIWPVGLVMAGGQVLGGWLGARTGIRFGARVIRPLVAIISIAFAIKTLMGL